MKWIDNLYKNLERFVLQRSSVQNLHAMAAQKDRRAVSYNIDKPIELQRAKTLNDWKRALMMAKYPQHPDFGPLAELYSNLMLDNHLSSVIDSRILRLQRSAFKITDKNGEENKHLQTLLERPWMNDLIRFVVFSQFQGCTLLELFDLDKGGELLHITEIPQGYFNPNRGIILKNRGETKGWDYKEGPLAPYYIQLGRDVELGMLSQLAPIVLSKKLGIGAWLDFIEKFGVPHLVIKTDRWDKKRLDELKNAGENFRGSNFLVLSGNETFDISQGSGSDSSSNFNQLIQLANSEISKRVLGQTGTTDEKSYVGSAHVHERVANDRHESDKTRFKYFFNDVLRYKLAQISPVYKDFPSHDFQWDNTTRLEPQELISAVSQLSAHYTMDLELIAQQTGIPITGLRLQTQNQAENKAQTESKTEKDLETEQASKKKIAAQSKIEAFYNQVVTNALFHVSAIDIGPYQQLIEKIAKDLHKGALKPAQLNKALVIRTYEDLKQGVKEGYGKHFVDYHSDKAHRKTVKSLKENLFRFSGAKSYQQLETYNKLLINEKGQVRPWVDFKKEVLKEHQNYNQKYLRTEYQTAISSGQAARNWVNFQEAKHIFPNLKYQTAGDDRVREHHQSLNNIVKPLDDAFWDTHYPPNGWNCRCYVVQTAEKPSENRDNLQHEIDKGFENNVGKTGRLFSEKHPYFALPKQIEGEVELRINNLLAQHAAKEVRAFAKTHLVGKVSLTHESLPQGVTLTNREIKTVVNKPHKQRVERNELFYEIAQDFKDADFLNEVKEIKGRTLYKRWFYFKSKQGDFYYNVAELSDGKFVLHAITDYAKK